MNGRRAACRNVPSCSSASNIWADPSRSAGDVNPIWSYAHVPFGYPGDATAAVVDQIERFAPGFRDRVIATVAMSTAELEAYNPNYVGGDIIGGANDGLQALLRPRIAVDPYFTGVPGVYLCSQSTPRAPEFTGCAVITPRNRHSSAYGGKPATHRRDVPRFATHSRSY